MQEPLAQIMDSPYSVICSTFITLNHYRFPTHSLSTLLQNFRFGTNPTLAAVNTQEQPFPLPHYYGIGKLPSVASAAHINGSPCCVHILFCMSWFALRNHRHGCLLDHLQTLRNIAWYAALSLRRQHKTPSIISDVRWGEQFSPTKTATNLLAESRLECRWHFTSAYLSI